MGEYPRFEMPKKESRYTDEIIALARKAAIELVENPLAEVHSFSIGGEEGRLFISRNPQLLVGSEEILLNNQSFYIGLFKISE